MEGILWGLFSSFLQVNGWVALLKKDGPVSIYDFSTLYTIISYGKLKHAMKEIIDFCFKDKKGKYIASTKCGAIIILLEIFHCFFCFHLYTNYIHLLSIYKVYKVYHFYSRSYYKFASILPV